MDSLQPLPNLIIDEKDPNAYKKTIEHEQQQRQWHEDFINLREQIDVQTLGSGLPKVLQDFLSQVHDLKYSERTA